MRVLPFPAVWGITRRRQSHSCLTNKASNCRGFTPSSHHSSRGLFNYHFFRLRTPSHKGSFTMSAQGPGNRGIHLNHFFARRYRFQPEKYIAGSTIYKRSTRTGMQRIVVKHAPEPELHEDEDEAEEQLANEEKLLLQMWGAEHIVRLLSIVSNQEHRRRHWIEPASRRLQNALLPWKLRINPEVYPGVARIKFFVMEYMSRGTVEELIKRCITSGFTEISEPLLWCFLLCLARACVAIAYPPNIRGREPIDNWREALPARRQPSRITHGDLHLGNVMFGDISPDPDREPCCHQGVPICR
ncbi:hypothetical protein GGS21DRAFT_113219 [Xylaria nigripes]|nr:hypothetical protein GGS21DRAFT_113219 [Xylaria nigripes]